MSDTPAFPIWNMHNVQADSNMVGLTKREWFAAQCLSGIVCRVWSDPVTGVPPDDVFEQWAKASFAAADAMIAESEKE